MRLGVRFLVIAWCCVFALAASTQVRPSLPAEEQQPHLSVDPSQSAVPVVQALSDSLPRSIAGPGTFDLRRVGFEMPSNAAILSNGSYLTVDFVDDDHLLVTFKKSGLVKRLRTCPVSHADHFVRALIYELSTAKVIRQTEWYLHDLRHYLWPLGGGRFLLRKADQLYRLDGALEEKLVLDSPRELTWVNVTPDGKQIIVETANDGAAGAPDKAAQNKPGSSFQARFLDAETLAPQRHIQGRYSVRMQGTSTGYPDLVRGAIGNLWLVRFGPDSKMRNYVARVKSPCTPIVLFPSATTMWIGRCSSMSAYSVSMFTVTGTRLWRKRWDYMREVPSLSRSEDGSRFAISTIYRAPSRARTMAPDQDDADRQAGVKQVVEVFETASGNPVTTVNPSPAFGAGQNFALSPDGSQMAVVYGTTIDFVRLAPPQAEERVKYLAVKADVPGLYAPSEETEDDASDADELELTQAEMASGGFSGEQASVASQPLNSAGPVATFKTSSRVVAVDVVVLDSKGKPVPGLTREDFAIKEDGVPQRIRYFEDNQAIGKKIATNTPVKRPQNVFSNAAEEPAASAVSVILYDGLNTPMSQMPYALQQLSQYLKTKPPDVRAALFTLTTSLKMITGFTEDASALMAAKVPLSVVGRAEGGPVGYDRLVAKMRQEFARQADQVNHGSTMTDMLDRQQQMQAEVDQTMMDMRVQTTLDAFAQLARYLSVMPGRKNVIWLSSSFPFWISAYPDSDRPASLSLNYNYGAQIKRTVNQLAAAHVAVYPVDVRGLATARAFDVSWSGKAESEDFSDPDVATWERATMRQIAEGTGGKAFTNTNGIKEAIQESIEQNSAFYRLSYTPTNGKYDGKFRSIRVEMAQRGYKAQYRTGYFAEDVEEEGKKAGELARELQVAALQPGAPSLRQIPIIARVVPVGEAFKTDAARFLPPSRKKAKKTGPTTITVQHYAVDYAIPAARLQFIPMPNGTLHGVFNFMVTAFDRSGGVVGRAGTATKSDLPAERYRELLAAGYRMHQELDIPISATALRMAVQDAATGNLATLEVALPLPPPPDLPRRKGRKALPEVEPD